MFLAALDPGTKYTGVVSANVNELGAVTYFSKTTIEKKDKWYTYVEDIIEALYKLDFIDLLLIEDYHRTNRSRFFNFEVPELIGALRFLLRQKGKLKSMLRMNIKTTRKLALGKGAARESEIKKAAADFAQVKVMPVHEADATLLVMAYVNIMKALLNSTLSRSEIKRITQVVQRIERT